MYTVHVFKSVTLAAGRHRSHASPPSDPEEDVVLESLATGLRNANPVGLAIVISSVLLGLTNMWTLARTLQERRRIARLRREDAARAKAREACATEPEEVDDATYLRRFVEAGWREESRGVLIGPRRKPPNSDTEEVQAN